MRQEVSILRRLNHPNVVQQREVIEDKQNEMMYVVMEYIAGGPAMQWNAYTGTYDATPERDCFALDMRTAQSYFCDAARGLHHIHSQHIIHRCLCARCFLTCMICQWRVTS